MKIFLLFLLILSGSLFAQDYTIVLHGGAGGGSQSRRGQHVRADLDCGGCAGTGLP